MSGANFTFEHNDVLYTLKSFQDRRIMVGDILIHQDKIKNRNVVCSNTVLNMIEYTPVTKNTYIFEFEGIYFWIILRDWVKAVNNGKYIDREKLPKTLDIKESQESTISDVFARFGYSGVVRDKHCIYASDEDSLMFVGTMDLSNMTLFIPAIQK